MKQASLGEFIPELKEKPATPSTHTDCFKVVGDNIVHPYIAENSVAHRAYQLDIALKALEKDTLVVIPTGLGKTIIAALVAADVLNHGKGKVVFLAPTKPLAQQHMQSFGRLLRPLIPMNLYTGSMPAPKRKALWDQTKVVFATPQGIVNDLENRNYDLREMSGLIIFDEAHRSVGDYAYVAISKASPTGAGGQDRLVLGLTASPAPRGRRFDEVMRNLASTMSRPSDQGGPGCSRRISRTDGHRVEEGQAVHDVRARRRPSTTPSRSTRTRAKRFGFIGTGRRARSSPKKDIISAGKGSMGRMKSRPGKRAPCSGPCTTSPSHCTSRPASSSSRPRAWSRRWPTSTGSGTRKSPGSPRRPSSRTRTSCGPSTTSRATGGSPTPRSTS